MKKHLLLLGLLGCCCFQNCKQHKENQTHSATNDSIEKYIDLAKKDNIALKKRIYYNDIAYRFIDTTKNNSNNRKKIHLIAENYSSLNQRHKEKQVLRQLINFSLKSNDSISLAYAYNSIGQFHLLKGNNNEKALEYFVKARKIFGKFNYVEDEIKTIRNISATQNIANDFLGSTKTSFYIIKKTEKINNSEIRDYEYANIGNNLSSLKNNLEAIKYYKKVNLSRKKINFKVILFNNIALSYIELEEYSKALHYVNKNIEINKNYHIKKENAATTKSLLGLLYLRQNNFKHLPSIFIQAENLFEEDNSNFNRNYNQIYLSMYYAKIEDTLNAVKAAEKAVVISKSYKNPNDILQSLKQLIKVDKKNATINAQKYIQLNDSLQIAERNFKDKFARIQFETDEITKEKDIAIQHKQNAIIISLLILSFGILFFIIYRQRTTKKELLLQQSNQKINEEIYQLMLSQKNNEEVVMQKEKKRIALELHDGVMNKLASTRLNLFILSKKTDPETIKKCITHISEIQTIEQEIRSISHDLNHEIFKNENSFIQMVKDLIHNKNTSSLSDYELEIDKYIPWNKISGKIKMNLYRILQEAIHNIEKHANAQKVIISLIKDENNICMSISDNGIGFDTEKKKNGIGIQNIQYRVKHLNGKININSFLNSSTSINISIPIT